MLNLTARFTGELPKDLQCLAEQAPTLARIFAGRAVTSRQQLDLSLAHLLSAQDLLGLQLAVALLNRAIDEKQHILIVGDFDCDGATSTALMVRVLRAMGAWVDFIVPDRFKYGYGLTPEIVELGIERFSPDVIVTVDNGISSHEGVARAKADGIEVIITDHHLTTKPTPNADAVVNPNQLGCEFASKSLVGVGVAFYVLGSLAKLRRQTGKSSVQVSQFLDLVALGTVADVGVLDQNNRILVYHGLQAIKAGRCCVGILALIEQAGRSLEQLTEQDFGFVIAPRINAAGRMDNMQIGIDCLLTDDWQRARQLAQQLDNLNRERRQVETKIKDEATTILSHIQQANPEEQLPLSMILYQDDWHQGVIGIVAGRLKEYFYRPSIVFAPADTAKIGATDLIKGSARSIAGIHIRDAIEAVAEKNPNLISHFGGHAMAAGLTIERQNFEAFAKAFEQEMAMHDKQIFAETQFTDGQLQAQDFSLAFVMALKNASIWGHGFVSPSFDGVFEVLDNRILKDKHLKLSLRYQGVQYPIDAIWFNFDTDKWDYRASQVHILFELDINEWNGQQSIQLMIKDLAVIGTKAVVMNAVNEN